MLRSDIEGLRDADLSPQERAALSDNGEHEEALALGKRVAGLPDPANAGPSAEEILERGGRRVYSGSAVAGGLLLAVAAAVGLVVIPGQTLRERGARALVGGVHLEAVATGPSGPRALADGDVVRPDEGVVFRVSTSAPGYAWVTDGQGQTVWPVGGDSWMLEPGAHVPGGEEAPQAYRPDHGRMGTETFRVTLCPTPDRLDAACASSMLAVSWTP